MTSDGVIGPEIARHSLRLLDLRDAGSFAAGRATGAVLPIDYCVAATRPREAGLENTAHWTTDETCPVNTRN